MLSSCCQLSRVEFCRKLVRLCVVAIGISGLLPGVGSASAGEWQAGAAKVQITPKRPMWMSGYASRTAPADGTVLDLWAKALVLQDPRGERAVLISLDLVGIHRDVSRAICEELHRKHQLERRQISLCTSHTHSGPVVGRTLMAMYFLDDVQRQLVADYTADLEQQIVLLVGEALGKLAPARLAWGNGYSSIAVNRRNNPEAKVPEIRDQGQLKGPVDHSVPVLSVRNAEGKLTSIVFGYACHATVLSAMQWSGDYPGYAQLELEKLHPDAVALFFAGCGGDQNPLPRRTVALAEEYGRSLAASVDAVLRSPMHAINDNLTTHYAEVDLALDKLPTKDELTNQSKSNDRYVAQRASLLLQELEAGRPLAQTYPYPVQLWRLGPELEWVMLGGEVTVEYSLRLKQELGHDKTWVAAYANDVMAYIPSLKVLKEGGYEGASSMVYYGLPTTWSPAVEETVLRGVHQLARGK